MVPIGFITKLQSNTLQVKYPDGRVENYSFPEGNKFSLETGTPYPLYFIERSFDNFLFVYLDVFTKNVAAMGGGKLDGKFLNDFILKLKN